MRRILFSMMILSLVLVLDACKKGDTGPQGPQGTQGTQGPQGPAGAAGAQGPAGATGAKGATGADGTKILSGNGAPGAVGVDNDFYLDLTNMMLYGPKTAGAWGTGKSLKGANGATGANGAPGATGAQGGQGPAGPQGEAGPVGPEGDPGATGSTGPQGPQGPAGTNGTNFLAGSGAPDCTVGNIGDFYFDAVTSTLYGPKLANTGTCWGASTAIGVTATARTFFLDIGLDGRVDMGCCEGKSSKIITWHDTSLTIDQGKVIRSSRKAAEDNRRQRTQHYAGWWKANGREIMFVDNVKDPTQLYLVPSQKSDFRDVLTTGAVNTIGALFVYTQDPANKAFMDAVRAAGRAAGLWYVTDPYYFMDGSNVRPDLLTDNQLEEAQLFNDLPSSKAGGGGLRYNRNATQFNLPAGAPPYGQAFTFSNEDWDILSQDASGGGLTALCYWMYAEVHVGVDGAPNTLGPVADYANVTAFPNNFLDFLPFWKKKEKTITGDGQDWVLKKAINLNDGKIRKGENDTWNDLNLELGAAWTAARKEGSIDFSYRFIAPTGYTGNQSSIGSITYDPDATGWDTWLQTTASAPIVGGPQHIIGSPNTAEYRTDWNQGPKLPTVPLAGQGMGAANINGQALQNWYNTWTSLNNLGIVNGGSTGIGSGSNGIINGSGPTDDYGDWNFSTNSPANGAVGSVYDVTPPAYSFSHFVHYNGKLGFNHFNPWYGLVTVNAPVPTTRYPWSGIVIRNGIIYVNYMIYNGGKCIRGTTRLTDDRQQPIVNWMPKHDDSPWPRHSHWLSWPDWRPGVPTWNPAWYYDSYNASYCDDINFAYRKLLPRGYFFVDDNNNAYVNGPWPNNQNNSCAGQYFDGNFIPFERRDLDDILIRFKIQTLPSSRVGTTTAKDKAGL